MTFMRWLRRNRCTTCGHRKTHHHTLIGCADCRCTRTYPHRGLA